MATVQAPYSVSPGIILCLTYARESRNKSSDARLDI